METVKAQATRLNDVGRKADLKPWIVARSNAGAVATSMWDASLHVKSATALNNLLCPPLDSSLDALRVVQTSRQNQGTLGVDDRAS